MNPFHNSYEKRKYLTPEERERFKEEAMLADTDTRTFCLLLYYTGIRISEGLNVLVSHIDFPSQSIAIRSLKKRKTVYRSIPLAPFFLEELDQVYNIRNRQKSAADQKQRIWKWSRNTAYLRVKGVIKQADVIGTYATPNGLRHGFAIYCIMNNIPLHYLSKWMGHNTLRVTAIYANALGKEERALAARTWDL